VVRMIAEGAKIHKTGKIDIFFSKNFNQLHYWQASSSPFLVAITCSLLVPCLLYVCCCMLPLNCVLSCVYALSLLVGAFHCSGWLHISCSQCFVTCIPSHSPLPLLSPASLLLPTSPPLSRFPSSLMLPSALLLSSPSLFPLLGTFV
jgi:hypothetical protein